MDGAKHLKGKEWDWGLKWTSWRCGGGRKVRNSRQMPHATHEGHEILSTYLHIPLR